MTSFDEAIDRARAQLDLYERRGCDDPGCVCSRAPELASLDRQATALISEALDQLEVHPACAARVLITLIAYVALPNMQMGIPVDAVSLHRFLLTALVAQADAASLRDESEI